MYRRKPILLLELLISLVIMGMILEMLFLGYRQVASGKEKLQIEKEIVLGRQRLWLRLGSVFQTLTSCKPLNGGFSLCYEGGMDPDLHFRGPLEGYLYVEQGKLKLASWPQKGPPRLETLYEDVAGVELQFFDSKEGKFGASFPDIKPIMMKMVLVMKDTSLVELPFFL